MKWDSMTLLVQLSCMLAVVLRDWQVRWSLALESDATRATADQYRFLVHNLTLATLGVFILLIGWYGFNPGSQLAFSGAANTQAVCLIAVNTTLAACAGGIVGMVLSWIVFKKPDLTMCLNGILGGLGRDYCQLRLRDKQSIPDHRCCGRSPCAWGHHAAG